MGSGEPVTVRYPVTLRSPDLTRNLHTSVADFGLFAGDFGGNADRSDFNGDGAVNVMDFGLFSPFLNYGCVPAP